MQCRSSACARVKQVARPLTRTPLRYVSPSPRRGEAAAGRGEQTIRGFSFPSALGPRPSALSPRPSALGPQPTAHSPQPSALRPPPSALRALNSPLAPQGHLQPESRDAAARRRTVARVEERFAHAVRGSIVSRAPSPGDLVRIAAESSRSDYDRVVVCGGDGTLNLALREFDLATGTLALIPTGSGDDFARVTGVPRDIAGACRNVIGGRVREVDVALANDIRYLGVAGLGFDSEVADYRESPREVPARLRRVSLRDPARPAEVHTAAGADSARGTVARSSRSCSPPVGNTRQYGGGIRITPEADRSTTDCSTSASCTRRHRLQLLKTLPKAYTGAHVKSPFVEIGRGREFRFESTQPMAVYADGEPLTQYAGDLQLAEQRLKFVCRVIPVERWASAHRGRRA